MVLKYGSLSLLAQPGPVQVCRRLLYLFLDLFLCSSPWLTARRSVEKQGCIFPEVDSVTHNSTHTYNSCMSLTQASALNWLPHAMLNTWWGRFETRVCMNIKRCTRIKIYILDFKFSHCCECCFLSFAWFSCVWDLCADVSEYSVSPIFICSVNKKNYTKI